MQKFVKCAAILALICGSAAAQSPLPDAAVAASAGSSNVARELTRFPVPAAFSALPNPEMGFAPAATAGMLPKEQGVVTHDVKSEGRRLYQISLFAVGAANAADTFSSWGQAEANPLLGSKFSSESFLIKAGFIGASFAVEHLALRHNPSLYKKFAWMNFAIAAGLGGVAAHNVSIR